MSKLKVIQSDPQKVSVGNQPPQTVRVEFTTYKIASDEDMEEFIDDIAKGLEIVLQVDNDNCTYIVSRRVIPVKIAL